MNTDKVPNFPSSSTTIVAHSVTVSFLCCLICTCGMMILQANVLIAVDEYNEFYQPSGWFWGEEERRISPQEFPILEVRYTHTHVLHFINIEGN